MSGISKVPEPRNETVREHAPGSPERAALEQELARMAEEVVDIPVVIGEQRISGPTVDVVMPHDHRRVIGKAHRASAEQIERAIGVAEAARPDWAALPFEDRAAIFLRAADLLTGPVRHTMNAATMLGQSKTAHQAEIDSVCELADFWRFNVAYAEQIMREQPISVPGIWNRTEYRSLDGFVLAISPFNFTAIGGNLPTAPALMGNTVLWKPATTQMRSAHVIMNILTAAGLPPGVVNMVQGDAATMSARALASPAFAGLHFTGSTGVFQRLWSTIGQNIHTYRQYPRIVGETGGKDFIFAHESANVEALACAMIRGAFEYQGQKCSAASRAYIPRTLWPRVKERVLDEMATIQVGDVRDFKNYMGAVIDAKAFASIKGYVDLANGDGECTVLSGGTYDDSVGWFVKPTLVETSNPKHRLMREEIFGPVLTVWIYDDTHIDEALDLCDTATPYALTGAVFADDRYAVDKISKRLAGAAGNFYINDKPTGAVVGQQPFGGGRASGTNDKAGSAANLMRWTSVRAIKETFVPATNYRYPYMG